ncbi:hypothetical protein SERLA73DRAFT_188774 [Serpula lacrymans var. lacrymans S7.3]|uniref:Hydrophobin n=2 Tax=Serpula lacrymans var. lacrymans TaxID=341189 RepID=F8QC60_SERL3|nr:hydrophobin [Serpula lacrymans var. lacrymans S7.9]XP_007323737.1 hydrophobin [Serpula lacrymans var. lacrymans S7.9]EGN94178.1 hypothetical protein SERLA73DRAFT_188773 [Serpula lacrymans var. lacrymans S7.3]EGN94179.1 hypothetical protein SERLA73DRAFT_188774 [Serpula lacrymans var. lacrymans S7.3]EGO19603.1 hydrophobin [Serpula lacrymans var. lacrymans S7.9]EGO19604.1 hydrophobin [Serpula lacrymans var. lacrymans S7.9]
MFSRISAVSFTLLFALLAVATPDTTTNQCNTGSISCCQSTKSASDAGVIDMLTAVGISLKGVVGDVGFQCSPITGVGAGGGSSCNQEPVCCTDNHFDGLINVGCSPININL